RDLAQHFIALRVAVAVVEQFEFVEIEEDERQRLPVAARAAHFAFERAVEMTTVGDAGERVDADEVFQPAVGVSSAKRSRVSSSLRASSACVRATKRRCRSRCAPSSSASMLRRCSSSPSNSRARCAIRACNTRMRATAPATAATSKARIESSRSDIVPRNQSTPAVAAGGDLTERSRKGHDTNAANVAISLRGLLDAFDAAEETGPPLDTDRPAMTPAAPSASQGRFRSFADFYPFYLSEHRDPVCRRLH